MFTENKITEFKNKIAALADRPQMSAQALKEYFDSSAEELRIKFNALIDALDSFGAASLDAVDYNAAEYKLTFTFKNGSTQTIDLPLELLIESGHYDADTQCIVLTLANSDVITIPVSDLIDEYEADEKTLHMAASETSRVLSVKEGVFATEAPADNKPYMRKDGEWTPYTLPEADEATVTKTADGKFAVKDGVFTPEADKDGSLYARRDGKWEKIIDSLPEITLAQADDILEGVYRIRGNVDDVGLLCASTDLYVYDGDGVGYDSTVDIEGEQTVIWGDGRILKRSRLDGVCSISDVVKNADGSYSLRPGHVFYVPWSAWESVIPSLASYAKHAYVDTQIANADAFKVVCEGELDETTGGVMAISAEITKDISKMREFHFYVEFPVTEENAGTNMYVNANISGAVAGNNSFFSVNGLRAGTAGNTYHTMCISNVVEGADGKYILSMQTQIMEKFYDGTSSRTNALSAKAPWVIPANTTLYLNINNMVQFLSGTKWRLEGR